MSGVLPTEMQCQLATQRHKRSHAAAAAAAAAASATRAGTRGALRAGADPGGRRPRGRQVGPGHLHFPRALQPAPRPSGTAI